jgi:transketolase
MNTADKISELEKKAKAIRNSILDTIVCANKGHIGGSFSCTDVLVALYYGGFLRYEVSDPENSDRDRLILSKGHSCAALYSVLADLGFISHDKLKEFCQDGTDLGGHPDRSIPGIEADTGSLGHGLGIGAGLALSAKLNKKDFRTVVLLGDGECYEGSVWEAANFASHYKLNNLTAIVDRNGQCVTDFIQECNDLEPFADKWKAFGWEVRNINGHSFKDLLGVFSDFRSRDSQKPLMIIADTVKGKGVSFMERKIPWHHSVPKGKDLETARGKLKT